MKKTFIYARVSTGMQQTGLEAQIRALSLYKSGSIIPRFYCVLMVVIYCNKFIQKCINSTS